MKVTIIGTGAYGIALAHNINKNHHDITMWTESEKKLEEWKKTKKLDSVMPDYPFPKDINITDNLSMALNDTDAIIISCGSKYVSNMAKEMKPFYKPNTPICIATKGLDEETCNPLSVVVKNTLKAKNIAVISGPTFAVDMIHNDPVALAIATSNYTTYHIFVDLLANDRLKLRKSRNMLGVQLCGSVKNVIAIASGILSGLGYSESTTAFLINESLHEIKHMIKYLGGNPKTILSYAGVGDLLMTCMSKKSRNYSFGYVIGHDKTKKKVQEYLDNNTVEGYNTLKAIINLNERHNIHIELINLINDIVDGNKKPEELVTYLINKE